MKITVAIDSFKGSLSSLEAGEAVKTGICRVYPDAKVEIRPLADGGEGTAAALTFGMGGEWVAIEVTGPLGKPVSCSYGMIRKRKMAIMEMSAAAGLTLVSEEERNPMNTTTYGVGEMIADAIKRGCRKFIIGIGGSATNDGGIGMLQALGFGLLNKEGSQVPFGAKGLSELAEIDEEHVLPELSECEFKIACDVTNPLCGSQGCSAVFGLQKGATPEMVLRMDEWLSHYAALVKENRIKADKTRPGAGAAGGLGFAFLAFTKAVLESGTKIIFEETNLLNYIEASDMVITGEGRLDRQTVMGKAPIGVAKMAQEFGKPVIAFSGCAAKDAAVCNEAGIDAYFPILQEAVTTEEAMEKENAASNLRNTAEQVFRLIRKISQGLN